MTTVPMLPLLPDYDDALVADVDPTFALIDREVALAREQAELAALLLDVDWLVEEMCAREALDISLELTADADAPAAVVGAGAPDERSREVA